MTPARDIHQDASVMTVLDQSIVCTIFSFTSMSHLGSHSTRARREAKFGPQIQLVMQVPSLRRVICRGEAHCMVQKFISGVSFNPKG